MTSANMTRDINCEVYAFVEATPISGPALICMPQSDSFERELPTVFVTPMILALAEWQYRRALRVSAVSPR